MSKKILYTFTLLTLISSQAVYAFQPKEITAYFNGPIVTAITPTSARALLSPQVLQGIDVEDRKNIYFEYYNTQKICIAIYPTPEACRPKKTELGKTDIVIDALQASTTYSIVYKKDNTIRCIMAPCPTNDFTSLALEFTTKPKQEGDVTYITKNLFYGLRDQQVVLLQKVLIRDGYLFSQATGYFGRLTLAAVMKFQSDNDVPRTGYVGPITRKVLYTTMQNDTAIS